MPPVPKVLVSMIQHDMKVREMINKDFFVKLLCKFDNRENIEYPLAYR